MSDAGQERSSMTAPDPGSDPFLSPPLDAEQLALLSRYGQERPTTAGQVLFREGDRAYDFIVVLSGAVSVVDHEAGAVRDLGTLGPGRFVAELNISTWTPTRLRARCSPSRGWARVMPRSC
jgi:thioredoxin reductase (NADPH)